MFSVIRIINVEETRYNIMTIVDDIFYVESH